MSKKITTKYEYRYYDMPIQEPILALINMKVGDTRD